MLRFVVKAFIIFIALQANTDSLMRKGWKSLQVFFFSAEDEVKITTLILANLYDYCMLQHSHFIMLLISTVYYLKAAGFELS